MSRYLLGTFLAALALFVWGAVFWMSPFPYKAFAASTGDAEAGAALLKHFPQAGTYLVPGMHNDTETLNALHRRGPIATVHIDPQGHEPMQPRILIVGFIHGWVCTLLAAFLAVRAVPAVSARFGQRLWFFVLVGTLVAVFTDFSAPIWWMHPWPYHLVNALYHVTAWIVAGLVLAAVIKPARA